MPLPLDRDEGKRLFKKYHARREGIRLCPEMASLCLICESIDIIPKPDDARKRTCRNCGFAFLRYACPACGITIDGRDPGNPVCSNCGGRLCSCGRCDCPAPPRKENP